MRRQAGFSLIETLVALTLIAVALLLTMSLIAQEPQIDRRLAAHSEALEILDTLHEAIRAGLTLPTGTEPFDWERLYDPPRQLAAAQSLSVWTEVTPRSPRGLYRVVLRARYFVGSKSFDREIETMIWRP